MVCRAAGGGVHPRGRVLNPLGARDHGGKIPDHWGKIYISLFKLSPRQLTFPEAINLEAFDVANLIT